MKRYRHIGVNPLRFAKNEQRLEDHLVQPGVEFQETLEPELEQFLITIDAIEYLGRVDNGPVDVVLGFAEQE